MDPNPSQPLVICEVCGTYFETRRGLSSHARLHLRQLGVTLSETSGAPIDLLYQIIQERDGTFPKFKKASATPVSTPPKKSPQQEPSTPPVLKEKGASSKVGSKAIAATQKKGSQGPPTATKESVSAFLTTSSSPLKADSKPPGSKTSTSLGPPKSSGKPLWAPQETDAPLTLATNSNDEVHVCQLCGAWYETRKGLSSHARAHLRQFGVAESTESKGGPIELLYQIMEAQDVKSVGSKQQSPLNISTSPKSSTKHPPGLSSPPMPASTSTSVSPEPLQSPPTKRTKPSREFTCILCGEEFENRKGLASHARSHLRQIGVSELVGKASAINTVEELVSTGVLAGVQTLKTTKSATSSSPAPALDPMPSPAPSTSSSRSTHSPHTSSSGAPKAKKGFRLAVDPLKRKPKPELVEIDVSSPLQGNGSTSISLSPRWLKPNNTSTPTAESFSAGSFPDMESIPLVPCDYCSQLFDSRKALSCHARAHLRQLGIPWSINESPITVLKEFMNMEEKVKNENIAGGGSASGKHTLRQMCPTQGPRRSLDSLSVAGSSSKPNTPPLNFSLKEKTSPSKNGTVQPDTSCELCGFDFDNRKALASHARAHLRQLGVTEWKADGVKGSPIKLLSEWIQREPGKVAEITHRYRMGSLYIRKTQKSDPSTSMDSDSSALKPLGQHPEHRLDADVFGGLGGSSKTAQGRSLTEKSDTRTHVARGELSLCFQKGFRSPKRPAPAEVENQDSNSQQPSRSGNIPALLPKPPLDPLVKLVGKVYSLKCRFCEEVFHGPVSIQEDWVRHLQEHILKLGYRDKASPPATPVAAPALLGPVAV